MDKFIEYFPTVFEALNVGFLQTLKLFAITLLGALPLGLIISFGSMSKFKPLSGFTKGVIWVVRGTPLMIQLLVIYYMPGLMFDFQLWRKICIFIKMTDDPYMDRFIAAAVAFIINYACYFSEIYRGGIQGVPQGQTEAGQVLGMSKSQIFFKVTLLQMIKRIIPPMSNEVITLVKDTALARVITYKELIFDAESFLKSPHGIVPAGLVWPLFFSAVYYLLFCALLTLLFSKAEKKLSYFKV